MSSFDCISFIENESDFPIFNESLMNNKKSTKNSFCDDLLENLGITNKNINSENDLQEGNCVQNVNYFEDDMDVDNRLDEFNIPEVTEFNKNWIVNMHSLHEDQPSMNVDIQNKNILTYEIKDIKEDKIEDAVISSNTNSLSSMNCSTAPSTPVKKASNQNTRSKNLAKRKRNRSNNRKIHENKDSEVPTKRFKKSEQKCNEKLEEAIGKLLLPLKLVRMYFFYDLNLISTNNMEFYKNVKYF